MSDAIEAIQDMENRVDTNIQQDNSTILERPDNPPVDNPIEGTPEVEPIFSTWMLDEGTPGTGEKPEWLNDKYKSASAQAKAYNELQKRFGSFTGKPEDGYNFEKYGENINKDDEIFTKFQEIAADSHMSQEGMEKIVDLFVEHDQRRYRDVEKIKESMTPEQHEQATIISQWVENNFSAEEAAKIDSWVKDLDSLDVLAKLRGFTKETHIPNKSAPTRMPSSDELQKMIIDNYEEYKNNTNGFRDRVDGMMVRVKSNR